MPKVTKVYLTALPNGVTSDKKRLRLSVLLSPKDEAGLDDPTNPFVNWPLWIRSGNNPWNAHWTVTINGMNLTPTVIQSLETQGPDLWTYIFDGYLSPPTNPPRDLKTIGNSWVIAHRAHLVQSHLDTYRTIHSRLAIPRPRDETSQVMMNNLSAQRTVNRNAMRLYIHPRVGATGPGDANLEQELHAAAQAIAFFGNGSGNLFSGEQPGLQLKVARRINYGLKRLGAAPGRRLRGIALLALYQSCAASAQAPRTIANVQAEIGDAVYGQTATMLLHSMQHFVEFRIFHQRSKEEKNAMHRAAPMPPNTNDFQTMLARVNQFPALLRPLGLVVDLEVEPPPGTITAISVRNAIQNPPFTVVPMTTNCTVTRAADQGLLDFYPTSNGISQLLRTAGSSRYVFLQATADNSQVFQFVTEDTDGSAQKATDQEDAQSRAAEYQSTASADSAGSDTASGRSVGITLLYTQRVERTQQALNRTADIASAPDNAPPPLFAEDLMLGFRVDVRRDDASSPQERTKWRSLSNRTGKYQVLNASGASLDYVPASDIEKAVDEGFISPMASSPVPPSNQNAYAADDPTAPPDPIVQVHESLFTWTGWSLSVKPIFKSSASSQGPNQDPSKRIIPQYTLDEHSLPPLRFDKAYTFRCRMVDLAGNSVSADTAETSADILSTYVPRRLEPARPPHVLLTRPLRRTSAPGEQADVLAIRDGRGVSSRILAAPRETVRIAEMHDRLNSPDLPTDAFSRAILMKNGSFPSVATADDSGLLDGVTLEGKPNVWNDAIFLPRKDRQRPDCPYLPDPWANWLLITPSLVGEPGSPEPDPFQSQSIYIGLYNDPDTNYERIGRSTWPDCVPVKLSLAASSQGQTASYFKRAELSNDDTSDGPLTRALSILVPQARTVTVQISTARGNPNSLDTEWAGSKSRLMTLLEEAGEPASATLLDGTHAPQTPPIQLTLVHAVRQPLVAPSFSDRFTIQRDLGHTEAKVKGDISSDWWSTAKITCHANWTDQVDNTNLPAPGPVANSEVALELLAIGGDGNTTNCRNARLQLHRFRDTRAHTVTYKLRAATAFRSFYAENDKGSFVTNGQTITFTVNSSIRPPAPSIAYIVPAFLWEDGYNPKTKEFARGRISGLRLYLRRPFLVSGDHEEIGFVIPPAGANEVVLGLSSRRGLDPIWAGGKTAGANDLTAADFAGGGSVATACTLAETPVKVDVVPFKVQFCVERNMWYCDVRIDSKDAYTPFVRLGVVRYQPDSVVDGTGDARISPVVVADFMQLAPNRWLHLHKEDNKKYSLTISGVTYQGAEAAQDASKYPECHVPDPGKPIAKHSTFNLTVQQRWHAVGRDLGWRPAACAPIPNCSFSEDSGITVWRYNLKLDHSSSTHKYRVLIEEYEWFPVEKQDMSGTEASPKSRLIYADFIEL